jgi:hypothetical protein
MSDVGGDGATDLRAVIDRWAALVKATSDDPPDSILRPPASEAAIAALEARLGTTLPPSYRAFLTISDGAAAFPAWGLVAGAPGSDPSGATGLRDAATVDRPDPDVAVCAAHALISMASPRTPEALDRLSASSDPQARALAEHWEAAWARRAVMPHS